MQVRERRYRIPDVCIARGTDPDDLIVRTPPLLCIEVLSSKDTMAEVGRRAEDYRAMGVKHIWVTDPWNRRAFSYGEDSFVQPEDGVLRIAGTSIEVALTELFAELDL